MLVHALYGDSILSILGTHLTAQTRAKRERSIRWQESYRNTFNYVLSLNIPLFWLDSRRFWHCMGQFSHSSRWHWQYDLCVKLP